MISAKRELAMIYKDRTKQDEELYSAWSEEDDEHLTVYTEPVPKARPRFTSKGHAYTPQKTASYESLIRSCWIDAFGKTQYTGYIEMTIDFYLPIAKSMKKSDKEKAQEGEVRPDKKPDIDNLVKSVTDALNETAFWDDKQIISLRADKWYSEQPRIAIRIREIRKE